MQRFTTSLVVITLSLAAASRISAQQEKASPAALAGATVTIEPSSLTVDLGAKSTVKATVRDRAGNTMQVPVRFVPSNSWALAVNPEGEVTGLRPGSFRVTAVVVPAGIGYTPLGESKPDAMQRVLTADASVTVRPAAVAKVEIDATGTRFYTGPGVRFNARVTDAQGEARKGDALRWSTSDATVATVDDRGVLTALKPGVVKLIAEAGGVRGEHSFTVLASPVARIQVTAAGEQVRTGDVVRFAAHTLNAAGAAVTDAPVRYALSSLLPDDSRGTAAPAEIDQQGRFVAEQAGTYTVYAMSGKQVGQKTITVAARDVARNIKILGRGTVDNVHTSDLWVCSQGDRDYAVTGSEADGGIAYFWDVTNPGSLVKTDSIVVDARTVNDVKMDEDCKIAVLTREGASNRRNGLVIVDISDPRHVKVLANYDDGLTGGVHNVFVYKKHIYALSAGRRYDIIDIADPSKPHKVSQFELTTPGHGIHDVWVDNGIAYSSQWQDGTILVDVGNGIAGGTPEHPVQFGQYKYPSSGGVHTTLPYHSKTGKFYVLAGDGMIWPYGIDLEEPSEPGGYIHVIDFTDVKHPEEVARYQLTDTGPHNYWIENDVLYIAHYSGGVRVVDVSGELKGDLSRQGREMAKFKPYDRNGVTPNTPMTWGVMPWKGHFFFSDMNSGLWSAQLEPAKKLIP
jgi:hypothetical protein